MISLSAEYALRAIVLLASEPDRQVTTEDLGRSIGVSRTYLAKVMRALGRAGLVQAQRGLGGGFVLSRSPDRITVLEVINAMDPIKRITHCPLNRTEHRTRLCALHRRLDAGIEFLEKLYAATTIAELLGEGGSEPPFCAGQAAKHGIVTMDSHRFQTPK
jgi:Rrf2 family protein